ncbi:hypothetical protein WIS52_30085 [Pseudonocardia nematodicida]|uniref:Uncharacterized protein n=1 Tax=Pseudonocardia nematodicida TaxID=1206997 RepID=A0ABV1KM96_9PSEU
MRCSDSRAGATHPAAAGHLVVHLEEFWPSRRPAAFDEFCPGTGPRR